MGNYNSTSQNQLSDKFRRGLSDLRISVTDRCNFRCTYCMPKEVYGHNFKYLDKNQLLSLDEIASLAKIFKRLGTKKIRITGGEPLLRKEIEVLIEKIAKIGFEDITLTTNGALLERKAHILKKAGLNRVTVSLDSLDDTVFKGMNDVNFPVNKVLRGIDAAHKVGLDPVKINMVVKRGVNEKAVVEMCRYFKGSPHIVRFIEFMDVGSTNGWKLDHVVSTKELVANINKTLPIVPVDPNYSGEVANRWHYVDGDGEIGFISSVSQAFCEGCTRARISADGKLYTCLFASKGYDLKALLRSNVTQEQITGEIKQVWSNRKDRYSEIRTLNTALKPKIEMSYIGG